MKRVPAFWASVVAAIAVCLAGANLAQAQISGDVVRLGVLTDFESIYSEVGGKGSVAAAQMAIGDFGGTVLGKPVELIWADHGNKADTGSVVARRWYDEQGVDLILDVPNSSVALAVQHIARDKQKLVIFSSAASNELTGAQCSPFGFQWTYDAYSVGKVLATSLATKGSTWFFLTIDTAGGTALEQSARQFIEARGGRVVGSVRHPVNAPDMSSFILQAQTSKADFVALANAGTDLVKAAKQANEFGLTPKQKLVGIVIFMSDLRSMGLDIGRDLLFVTGFDSHASPEAEAWAKRFVEKTGRMPNDVHAGIYSATLHYLNAVKAAGTDDAKQVAAKMREMPVNDMFAKNGIVREDGRMAHDMYVVQAKKPSESSGPLDLTKLLQVVPGADAVRPLSESNCPLVKR
jgi:branched-chain amino acid transport system substrate-binding protein